MKNQFLQGLIVALFFMTSSIDAQAQINASLMRFPDVSDKNIVFAYANDIWIVPKTGGEASRLSSPKGQEVFPKFSPDGQMIAFSGNYDGNNDVFVMPVAGGIPQRLTSHGYTDRVIDWTADGNQVIFASSRESGKARYNQFYKVHKTGGTIEKLPLEYAEYGSLSPDGSQMAVVYITQIFRTWKRYKGGTKGKIVIYNFKDSTSRYLSLPTGGGDEFPMWHANNLYFISDRGSEERMNLYKHDLVTGTTTQLTNYTDYDIHFPSLGPAEIVYEQGGKLHLYNLAAGTDKSVSVTLVTDETGLKPKMVSTENYIQSTALSPDGKRVLIEARGDIYSLPAKDGFVKNLTQTSGVAERTPVWSPDGKSIAFWSDKSGEYEIYIQDADLSKPAVQRTKYGKGYRYNLFWSPDSKKISFINQAGEIHVLDLPSGKTQQIDKLFTSSHGTLAGFTANWSIDSRWLTYARGLPNGNEAVFIYDARNDKRIQCTSGFYSSTSPIFDESGKYLFLTTNQSLTPQYSDMDNTFIYTNSTKLAFITLSKDSVSLLAPVNDTVAVKTPTDIKRSSDKKAEEKKSKSTKASNKKKEEPKKETPLTAVVIDTLNMEQRLELLTPAAGNMGQLASIPGKLLYLRYEEGGAQLKYLDLEKKEEKVILAGIDGYDLSADRKKLLVSKEGKLAVVDPIENTKFENPIRKNEMTAFIDPRQEWEQVFTDAWRLERDYFYDANMHGVNWQQVRERYDDLLKSAATREDVAFIIGEMIGELNASHTYYSGGDLETGKSTNTGYLGINWAADGDYYKVGKIIRGAEWDAEARSPLDQPGVKITEGDRILAVNGVPINTKAEPYENFAGLADKTIELTYSKPPFNTTHTAVVTTKGDEYRLRNLAWIEHMRRRVEEATHGEAGYIYVPSTGLDGQNELIRMFSAQKDKKALIIDERFNNGGQIPDRFIEMLDRKPLVYWATRDGQAWKWPPNGHFGPKVMLINGWSGSGGDAFPDYFRKRGLGPLIGSRTWGGLIGISGAPQLIDGANVTVPTFRMYNLDGTWFKEGYGVDPDIQVDENLGMMARGVDVQLERAIVEIKRLLKETPFEPPMRPTEEKR